MERVIPVLSIDEYDTAVAFYGNLTDGPNWSLVTG